MPCGHTKSPGNWGVDQWHHGIVKHDKNTCKGMKSTSMATNSPTLGVKSKGSFVVI